MYTYSIFLFKKNVAAHYFFKTPILHRFLLEYWENRKKSYLALQYNYVTDLLTVDKLQAYLQKENSELSFEKRDQQLKLYVKQTQMTFFEDEKHLTFTATSLADAEEFLFPILRRAGFPLFVVNHRTNDFGWLSVNIEKKMNLRHMLIS